MRKDIAVAGTKDETASELERALPNPMLPVASGTRPLTSGAVITAEHMQQIGRFEADSVIGEAFLIDQKRKIDLRLFAKQLRVIDIAKSNGCQSCGGSLKMLLVLAQLRDVLTAKDSTVMPQEDQYGRTAFPK